MADLVPVDHDPFNDSPANLIPVDHDPFALGPIAKPGRTIPPQNVLGDLHAATAAAGRFVTPNLAAYLNPPPQAPPTPLPEQGKVPPSDPDTGAVGALGDIAGLAMMALPVGGLAGAAERGMSALQGIAKKWVFAAVPDSEMLASRSARLYNPPVRSPTPFSVDYPGGMSGEPGTPLTTDIEGRPLTAQYIAGRRVVEGVDESLGGPQIFDAAAQATGQSPQAVANRTIGGDAGRYIRELDRRSGSVLSRNILYDQSLAPPQTDRVIGHEFGHVIDEIAGQIPQDGIKDDLKQFYNTLSGGGERTRNLTGPQHFGYSGGDVPKELMAEAIRGYAADPGYIKSKFPDLAKAISAAVNAHPTLSKIIQFNAIPAIAGTGAAGYQLVPVDHDPFAQ